MTKGIRDLRQIQIGFQGLATGTVCGTPVTPHARLVGKCGMKKLTNLVFPTEPTGLMSDHILNRAYSPWVMAEIPIEPGDEGATFQQLPWLLSMGIAGGVSGTGTGTPKTWSFCPNLIAGDMPGVATLRYGDNAGVWESICCFARQLVISGAFQGAWNITADVVGRDMIAAAFAALPYPTDAASFGPLETILGQMTSFYLANTCSFGTAQKTGSLIDWTVTVPGFHPKFFQDGVLTYTTMGLASRHLTLDATIEFDSVLAAAEHAKWVLKTPTYVRIESVGATPANAKATIDMVLMYESFETLDQRDGNDTIKFKARTVYDVGCVAIPEWCITVVNTFAALP